jgi:hypothetical protein
MSQNTSITTDSFDLICHGVSVCANDGGWGRSQYASRELYRAEIFTTAPEAAGTVTAHWPLAMECNQTGDYFHLV